MAENKKGFILYADQKALFDQLPNEKAGELIKHIFSYVNDDHPKSDDLIINLAFTPIKQQLKRDLTKYESTKSDRSKAGQEGNLKRWNLDLYKQYKANQITLDEAIKIAEDRKLSGSDKKQSGTITKIQVKETVTDIVTDIDFSIPIIDRRSKFEELLSPYYPKYPKETLGPFIKYWTEHNEPIKSNTKMRFELVDNQPFNAGRRLGTWFKKSSNNNSKKSDYEIQASLKKELEDEGLIS